MRGARPKRLRDQATRGTEGAAEAMGRVWMCWEEEETPARHCLLPTAQTKFPLSSSLRPDRMSVAWTGGLSCLCKQPADQFIPKVLLFE